MESKPSDLANDGIQTFRFGKRWNPNLQIWQTMESKPSDLDSDFLKIKQSL